ncbi:MAG: ribonucleotide-diphosphate reductase, partial [Chloroflexota bacterium]
ETGYHVYYSIVENKGIMPGNLQGDTKLKQDESRHIAYGIYLISRLVAENPDLWSVAEARMNSLLMPAIGVITEAFDAYDPVPFGLQIDDFVGYAMMQFQKRMGRIEKAKGASLEDIYKVTHQAIENEDA